jgi:hypothetical protein
LFFNSSQAFARLNPLTAEAVHGAPKTALPAAKSDVPAATPLVSSYLERSRVAQSAAIVAKTMVEMALPAAIVESILGASRFETQTGISFSSSSGLCIVTYEQLEANMAIAMHRLTLV